jgi:hypothetical protein
VRLYLIVNAIAALLLFATANGCGRKDPPATPPPAKAAPTPETKTPPATKVSVEAPSASPPAAGGLAPTNAKPKDKPKDDAPSPAPSPPPPTPERLALLTPGGPLLIEVTLTVDGHAYSQDFEAELDKVLAAADTNGDDRHTWDELINNADFLKTPLANAANATGPQKKKWAEDYDFNDNDYLERAEAAAWLGRDSGRSARAFSVRSTRSYRPDPRSTSRLWPLIDADNDGKLSAVEIRDTADALLALDANDDLMISAAELVPLRDQLLAADGQTRPGRTNLEHFAALHLEPGDDPARLEYLLNDLYAPRQDLEPASFPALTRLGEELDANSDNWLERAELAELLKVKPHLKLTVAFGQSDAPNPSKGKEEKTPDKSDSPKEKEKKKAAAMTAPEATVHIDEQAPEVKLVAQTSPGRVIISVGGTRIILSAHDLAPGAYVPQAAYGMSGADRNQIRLLAHDQSDAVFGELDANADARLSEREIKTVRDRLLARDADQNRELADNELPYSMIVAFVRGEAADEQSYYVPASPPPAAGGAAPPKWFTRADLNADGEISRREFLGSPDHFSQADLSRDGYIDASEAGETSTAP